MENRIWLSGANGWKILGGCQRPTEVNCGAEHPRGAGPSCRKGELETQPYNTADICPPTEGWSSGLLREQLIMLVIPGIFAISTVSVHCADLIQRRKGVGAGRKPHAHS